MSEKNENGLTPSDLRSSAAAAGRSRDEITEWTVSVGGGHSGTRHFDNEAEALAYFDAEMAVPSYFGEGHRRHGSITRVTTITEDISDRSRLNHAAAEERHYDEYAVDEFAKLMTEKLKFSREVKGRGGWNDPEQCSVSYLSQLLHEHVAKGDPVDVANLCMMLRRYGAKIEPSRIHPAAASEARSAAAVPISNPNAALVEALRPFAYLACNPLHEMLFGEYPDDQPVTQTVSLGDIRRAHKALVGIPFVPSNPGEASEAPRAAAVPISNPNAALVEALRVSRGYVYDAHDEQKAMAFTRSDHPKLYAKELARLKSIEADLAKIDAALSTVPSNPGEAP